MISARTLITIAREDGCADIRISCLLEAIYLVLYAEIRGAAFRGQTQARITIQYDLANMKKPSKKSANSNPANSKVLTANTNGAQLPKERVISGENANAKLARE